MTILAGSSLEAVFSIQRNVNNNDCPNINFSEVQTKIPTSKKHSLGRKYFFWFYERF